MTDWLRRLRAFPERYRKNREELAKIETHVLNADRAAEPLPTVWHVILAFRLTLLTLRRRR